METIPKLIHYCWFGGNPIPDALRRCMDSWKLLEDAGYRIIRWDESNCSFDENAFVRRCYREKKWAFVSDFYRAKALHEWGGIYLDTDVAVRRPFDAFLNDSAFIGFSCGCALSTAVIGAQKGSPFIKGILDMYETQRFYTEQSFRTGETYPAYTDGSWIPNNEFVTWYVICTHPDFALNNRKQTLADVTVYPKTYFELGSLTRKYYCRHINYNSWIDRDNQTSALKKLKHTLEKNTCAWILIRSLMSRRGERRTSFYPYRER